MSLSDTVSSWMRPLTTVLLTIWWPAATPGDEALLNRIRDEAPRAWRARQQEAYPIRGNLLRQTHQRETARDEFILWRTTEFSVRALDQSYWTVTLEKGASLIDGKLKPFTPFERIVCCSNPDYTFSTTNGVLTDFERNGPAAELLTHQDPPEAGVFRIWALPVLEGSWRLYGVHSLAMGMESGRLTIRSARELSGADQGKVEFEFELQHGQPKKHPSGVVKAVADPANGWGLDRYETDGTGVKVVQLMHYARTPLPGRKLRHVMKVTQEVTSVDPGDGAASRLTLELRDINGKPMLPLEFRLPAFGQPERVP